MIDLFVPQHQENSALDLWFQFNRARLCLQQQDRNTGAPFTPPELPASLKNKLFTARREQRKSTLTTLLRSSSEPKPLLAQRSWALNLATNLMRYWSYPSIPTDAPRDSTSETQEQGLDLEINLDSAAPSRSLLSEMIRRNLRIGFFAKNSSKLSQRLRSLLRELENLIGTDEAHRRFQSQITWACNMEHALSSTPRLSFISSECFFLETTNESKWLCRVLRSRRGNQETTLMEATAASNSSNPSGMRLLLNKFSDSLVENQLRIQGRPFTLSFYIQSLALQGLLLDSNGPKTPKRIKRA